MGQTVEKKRTGNSTTSLNLPKWTKNQQEASEQETWVEHNFYITAKRVRIRSREHDKRKSENSKKRLPASEMKIDRRTKKRWQESDKFDHKNTMVINLNWDTVK